MHGSQETQVKFENGSKFESESHSVVSSSSLPCGLCCPWNSLSQNTGLGSLCLLQGIFPAQGSNPGLPHCRQILYQLSLPQCCCSGRHCFRKDSPVLSLLTTGSNISFLLLIFGLAVSIGSTPTKRQTQFWSNTRIPGARSLLLLRPPLPAPVPQ